MEVSIGHWRRAAAAALAALAGSALAALPAAAQTTPAAYEADPLGLIARSELTRLYSAGIDRFAVWSCDTPDDDRDVDPFEAARFFKDKAQPYFDWLSGGRYVPEFLVAGTVTADSPVGCAEAVEGYETEPAAAGAIVAVDTLTLKGFARDGSVLGAAWRGEFPCGAVAVAGVQPDIPCQWPHNDRKILLGAVAVVPVPGVTLVGKTLAHELGHTLNWPHNFRAPERGSGGYDNFMDLMGGSRTLVGTSAVNRYAAGWIPPEQVAVHPPAADEPRPGALYDLAPVGRDGLQMLVLPTGQPGVFYTFEARVRSGYDDTIPVEGVEAYFVDQSAAACDTPWKDACWGLKRLTRPLELISRTGEVAHVFGVGSDIVLSDVRVRVLERAPDGSGYSVWVGSGPLTGTFFDDDGSVHEAAIEWLAAAGITRGCDRYRYCPGEEVTRAQAAVFLARAAALSPVGGSAARFADVGPGAWYAGYLGALVEAGAVSADPDGGYRPAEAVTRGELAVMLARTLELPLGEGPAFADVEPGTETASAASALAAARVTRGCSAGPPLRFCPDDPVTRAQIASLLTRSLA